MSCKRVQAPSIAKSSLFGVGKKGHGTGVITFSIKISKQKGAVFLCSPRSMGAAHVESDTMDYAEPIVMVVAGTELASAGLPMSVGTYRHRKRIRHRGSERVVRSILKKLPVA